MPKPAKRAPRAEGKKSPENLVEKTFLEVRKDPVKSVVWAFFGGLLLTVFPLGRVLRIFTGLAFSLVRPLLMLLGAVKLWEHFDETSER
jgi:hypothetical protein